MGKVADILEAKGSKVYCTAPEATVFDAVRDMVKHNVGGLVVKTGDHIDGIITERDYLREIVVKDRSSRQTAVKEIMSTQLVCVSPDYSVEDCMAIMTERRIRHLPVLEKGRLAGVVSVGDLIKQMSKDQEAHIQYLTDFIADKYPG